MIVLQLNYYVYISSHAYKSWQSLASPFAMEMHRQMAEPKRKRVLAYLLLGLLISSQCAHSHGFVIQATESREAQSGRRFKFADAMKKSKEEARDNSRKNPSGPNPIGNRHPPSIHG